MNTSGKYNTKNVIFLGAGASADAGFPLTSELFKEIENFANHSLDKSHLERWTKFENNIIPICNQFGVDFKKQNPEIILTLPDILETSEDDVIAAIDRNKKYTKNEITEYNNKYDKGFWKNASIAKTSFSHLLENFFIYKNIQIFNNNCYDIHLPVYLENMMSPCDTIITTNWDALPEFILFHMKKWSPHDGYGFERNIINNITREKTQTKSQALILKLHGSAGWRQQRNATFYIQYANFLQLITNEFLKDADEPDIYQIDDKIMLYPSYLKQLESPTLLCIWEKAKQAIESASSVIFVGYSLPKADTAIRALLLPLRSNNAEIEVVSCGCTEKSDERKIWTDYFDKKNIKFSCMKAHERFL